MRVIRHESGWDIALDMVFTDKHTADTIAKRIQHAVHALIRDAVDASMCGRKAANDAGGETHSGTAVTMIGNSSEMLGSRPEMAIGHVSVIAQTASSEPASVRSTSCVAKATEARDAARG